MSEGIPIPEWTDDDRRVVAMTEQLPALSDTEKAVLRLVWDWDSGRFPDANDDSEICGDRDPAPVAPVPEYFITAPLRGLFPHPEIAIQRLGRLGLLKCEAGVDPAPKPFDWILPDGRSFTVVHTDESESELAGPYVEILIDNEPGGIFETYGRCPGCGTYLGHLLDEAARGGLVVCPLSLCGRESNSRDRSATGYGLTDDGFLVARVLAHGRRPFDPFTVSVAGVFKGDRSAPMSSAAEKQGLVDKAPPLDEGSPDWIRPGEVALIDDTTDGSLKSYRSEGKQGWRAPDGLSGVDRHGRVWRKRSEHSHVRYYRPFLLANKKKLSK